MKIEIKNPPRTFNVGPTGHIQMKDCANIELEPDEQITLKTKSGTEYDIAKKSFGYYATPSLNGRLLQFGLRAVLVKSPGSKYYILFIEKGKENVFFEYIQKENQEIISWLDNDEVLQTLEKKAKEANLNG